MTTAAIIIGRNEGERLVRCLNSVTGTVSRTIYVDSGSTDDSVAAARSAGAEIVRLDPRLPFTAARARNTGLEALQSGGIQPDYVQFIDGDCELQDGWLATSSAFLDANPQAAIACGRRRERHPQASIYNRLCDREWNTPVGEAKACGGDFLARLSAIAEVDGFNAALIAGEEPEMCVRLRARGWQVWRLDAEMTLHDAAMTRFSQWWQRSRRAGYAAALGMSMHGAPPERHGVRAVLRAVLWAVALPLLALALLPIVGPLSLLLLLAYPLQAVRLALRNGGAGEDWEEALFLTIGKFAEAQGVMDFALDALSGRHRGIIEYK